MRPAALALLVPSLAWGWETSVQGKTWDATDLPAGSYHAGGPLGNEHAEIADDALYYVGPSTWALLGANAPTRTVLDLHASWLRRDLYTDATALHDPTAPLERREIPPIARFAGLPDFSYSLLDWVSRNTFCKTLPAGLSGRDTSCHDYGAWLGAGLNSTHFGQLANAVYGRHHAIALAQAAHAREMSQTLDVGGADASLPTGRAWHDRYVREREQVALIYETIGQHYLEDRLSEGHMMTRWGGGDYFDLDIDPASSQRRLQDANAMGLLSAIIHGTGAVFGTPDPMNYPLVEGSLAAGSTMEWKVSAANAVWGPNVTHNGVGDLLYEDLVDGFWGPLPLQANDQLAAIRTCGSNGYRQVIDGFAPQANGTHGELELSLGSLAPELLATARMGGSDPRQDPVCTEAWATNWSWLQGIKTITGLVEHVSVFGVETRNVGALVPVVISLGRGTTNPADKIRMGGAWLEAAGRAQLEIMRHGEDGVELARDGFEMQYGGVRWRPNRLFDVPSYYEPEDLDTLPQSADPDGMDLDALQGFFNLGFTERFCADAPDDLPTLRKGAADPNGAFRGLDLETCMEIGQRLHKGTDENYPDSGPRAERIGNWLPLDGSSEPTYGPEFEPVCAYFEPDATIERGGDEDDGIPYQLQPGYVETPGAKSGRGPWAQSLENWCLMKPVLHFLNDPANPAAIGRIDHLDGDRWLRLTGENLGIKTPSDTTGTVELLDASGIWEPLEVWDGYAGVPTGGWSQSNVDLDVRIPVSGQGFPSDAVPGMLPHEIKTTPARPYSLALTRPNDPAATWGLYKADGVPTVGSYEILIEPSWVETPANAYGPATQCAAFWAISPAWSRGSVEELAHGFYSESAGVYTDLNIPFSDIRWGQTATVDASCQVTWTPDPDKVGVVLQFGPGGADPAVWDGTVVYFYAYH